MSDSSFSGAPLRAHVQRFLLQVPALQRADARIHKMESNVLQGLKHKLDDLEDPALLASLPGNNLHQILNASVEQSPASAQQCLITRLLSWLTPDEARLLATFSEGSGFPLLTLYKPGTRSSPAATLHYHSNVGRQAGIQYNSMIAFYLTRLLSQGLIICGPMQNTLRSDYELCEGDESYRDARKQLEKTLPKVKSSRQTVYLSPTGQALWQTMTKQNERETAEQ